MPKADPSQGVLPVESPHNSQGLFAPHYLDSPDRLRSLKEWREVAGVAEAMASIGDLYKKSASRFGPKTKESQTEDKFIKPVLEVLGWEWETQEQIPGCGKIPDYALLLTHEDWEALQDKKGTDEFWASVPVLADAKAWEVSLDQKRDGETPTVQITNYLYRAGVRWGILTNGQKWRLYERDKSRAGRKYYEVDLIHLIERGSAEDFKYFYLFFRKQAFVEVEGQTFVERVLQGSADYATEVRDSVRESVYDAVRHLMNGFLGDKGNKLDRYNQADLKSVHDHSLILLYRLIFILYAEDAGLLARDEEPYRHYGLATLGKRVNETLRSGEVYLPSAVTIWHDLLNLFELIDTGHYENGRCVIPAYNGGLFSPQKFPVIAYKMQHGAKRWDIGDAPLAEAIDTVAYRREKWEEPGSDTVDYATLGVRHLGTIYEGLLELKPVVAEEEMIEQPGGSGKPPVVNRRRGVKKPKKVRAQKPREFAKDEVYLITDRGERKATGSYFTPEYIVNYIVDHTVTPLADEAAEKTAKIKKQVGALEKKRRGARSPKTIRALEQQLKELEARWLEPYLSLKILDPAMGSGHFLVRAADVLSLAMANDPNLRPVPKAAEHDLQGYYKQLVANHCLFGVDLNPLAVELAKLSLWLHTAQKEKALSFLDHHLRCGNSLIGGRVDEDLSREPPTAKAKSSPRKAKPQQEADGQLPFPFTQTLTARHLHYFLDVFKKIVEAALGDAETERQKDVWFREMEEVREPYKQVANLWLAPYFGVPVTAERYGRTVEALSVGANSRAWKAVSSEDWFQEAQRAAVAHKFFHWDLEFPEAFFEPGGRKPEEERGYHAVIGNPPYQFGENIPAPVRRVAVRYRFAKGQYDTYWLFFEHIIGYLLCKAGRHGFIVPDALFARDEPAVVREALDEFRLTSLIHAGTVFEDPNVSAGVVVWHKTERPDGLTRIGVCEGGEVVARGEIEQASFAALPGRRWLVHLGAGALRIIQRVFRSSRALGAMCSISRGEELGKKHLLRAAELVNLPRKAFIEILVGEDIEPLGVPVPTFYVQGDLVRKSVYQYRSPKIVFVKTGAHVVATIDNESVLTLQSVYNLHPSPSSVSVAFVAALLKSRLIDWTATKTFTEYKQLFPQFNQTTVAALPIRAIDLDHSTDTPKKPEALAKCRHLLDSGDYETPLHLTTKVLATHAALHGPGGRPELCAEPCWSTLIPNADSKCPLREDLVHDLLAMLAQRMIDLNKQKDKEQEGFLEWLQSHAGAAVHDMQLKTKIRAYHEHDFDTLLEALQRNKKLLPRDPSRRDFRERVKSEFDKSVGRLEPLKQHLAATDRLIDQIVYRLYGLTDDEIAIVEESSA